MRAKWLSVATILILTSSAVAQVRYAVTDLGRLSQRTSNSAAFSINDTGSVAITLPTADAQIGAQVWNGSAVVLNGPATGDTVARAINYSGTVAGWTSDASGQRACIWTNGEFQLLPVSATSRALALNDSGYVVGEAGPLDRNAFLWDAIGGARSLGQFNGSTSSAATGVNAYQEVVGFGTNPADPFPHRAFIWTESAGMRPLLPKFSGSTVAFAINDVGVAVGYAMNKNSWKAFVTNISTGKAVYYELPVLDQRSARYAAAYAVNRAGQVVGESNSRAFLIENGAIYDLNMLISADSNWRLSIAYGINASSQIVGAGMLNGEPHGFLLTPLLGSTLANRATAKGR